MKKSIKLSLLLTLALALVCLTGCAGSPSAKIKSYCNAINSMNYNSMTKCFEEDTFSEEDITDLYEELEEFDLEDFYKKHAKKFKYRLGTLEKDEDDDEYAYMDVTFTYEDYSESMIAAFDEYMAEYYADETGEVDETRQAEILKEHLENDTPGTIEEIVTFFCEKVDGKWVISYDYDVFERTANAITCNLMDTYDNYDYEEPDEDGDEDFDNSDVSDALSGLLSGESDGQSGNPDLSADSEFAGMDKEEILDYLVDYLDSVEGDGHTLVMNGYTVSYDADEDCYVVTGDLYDFDVYEAWRMVVADGQFQSKYPETYELLNNGLWSEDTELYIPADAEVMGIWPEEQDGTYTAVSDIETLLNSGHAFVYYEDDYPDIYEVYDSYTNYAK